VTCAADFWSSQKIDFHLPPQIKSPAAKGSFPEVSVTFQRRTGMRKSLLLSLILFVLLGCSAIKSQPTAMQTGGVGGQTAGNPNTRVWVNTKSGVYHCPGTRWYGNTKEGEYMSQKQALEKGNRPAYGNYCS
jgi:predicted membrane channel-forming protein YqfA (hemolysin III family)